MEKKELPEGWESINLGEAEKAGELIFQNGFACGCNNQDGRGVPQLRPMNVNHLGQIDLTALKFIEVDRNISNYILQKNDVLFNNTNSSELVGKTAIWEESSGNYVLSNHMTIIRIIKQSHINPNFLSRYFHHLWTKGLFKNICKDHINQSSVSLERLREIEIPLPPLQVQNRIVEILEQADALRHLRAQADAETQKLLQSVFYEMFGDPVRNKKGWEIRKIEDLCSVVTDGEHITPIRKNLGIFLLSARNIQNHKIDLSDVDFIDNEEYNRISQRIQPKRSDILLSCSGTIGRVAQIKTEEKFQLVRSVALLRPIEHLINPTYLEYSFDTHFLKNQIQKNIHQSSQGNLFQGKIKKLKVIVPPMDLQIRFARIIQKVEDLQANQKESDDVIMHSFDGLITGLFKGEYLTKVT